MIMKKLNIRNILVPTDLSDLSFRAIETAQRLAKRFNADLHLVHVHEYHYLFEFMAPEAPVPMSMIRFRDDAAGQIARRVKAVADRYGIPESSCYIQTDAPIFNEICKVARAANADLIVTPTHGRAGLRHMLLGSTAERVVQHSPARCW